MKSAGVASKRIGLINAPETDFIQGTIDIYKGQDGIFLPDMCRLK